MFVERLSYPGRFCCFRILRCPGLLARSKIRLDYDLGMSLKQGIKAALAADSSTHIKDVGIAIRHSRGYIISILLGLEVSWRGWNRGVHRQEIIKTAQFRAKITKIKVLTFWMSGESTDSRRRPMPACSPVSFKQSRLPFYDIARPNIQKNAGFGP